MTSMDGAAVLVETPGKALSGLRRAAPTLFGVTLFASALLLFAVQPMFTKMVLPKLGGAPAVWSVAMVAFQAFLFIGYVYAHLLARSLRPGWAAVVHLMFLGVVAAGLPLGIAAGFSVPPSDGVMLWLVGLFAASIGLPFVALAASAPLLQSWFAASGHPQAGNPYVLYAASNLGSFAALLIYPFGIEPFLTLQQQLALWSGGFSVLAVMIGVVGWLSSRNAGMVVVSLAPAGPRPTAAQRFSWTGLTAIPAGLVIAVTSYITTDIASAPFIWVIPLALYLLTFVAVFRDKPWIPHALVLRLLPFVIAPMAISILGGSKANWFATIVLNLGGMVLIALACHGEAYRRRPDAGRLTEFYLWTSFGGVLGGVFAGLLAPNVFNNVYEYPILVAAVLLVMPGMFAGGVRGFLRAAAWPLIAAAVVVVFQSLFDIKIPLAAEVPLLCILVAIAAAMLLQTRKQPLFFGLAVLAFVVSGFVQAGVTRIATVRSFFGVHLIEDMPDGTRLLLHGATLHGAERTRNADGTPITSRPEPLSYYHRESPFADAFASARALRGTLPHVALVGMGAGALTCYKQDGEQWTMFEIDPEVVRIATDPSKFHFVSRCAPDLKTVVGDARLTLAASSERYDMIVLDAFSSDAIPVHLLTREAFRIYQSRLAPNGVLVLHVSNKHLELINVVAAIASSEGLVPYMKRTDHPAPFLTDYKAASEVMAVAKDVRSLGDLPSRQGWRLALPRADVAAWTDDYSDLLRAILRKKLGS